MKIKTKLILTLFLLVFVTTLFAPLGLAKAQYSAGTLISLTNSERVKNGLGSLVENAKLDSAASAKVQDMINNQYFAHTSPQGKTPWDFIRGAGYEYIYAGENLAIGYGDAQELFNAWMNSTTHRENILNSNFREIGIAVGEGSYEGTQTIFVAQEFGARSVVENTDTPAETPAPEVSGQSEPTAQPTATPASVGKTFNFVSDKTSFYPKTVFVGEEVTLQVTVSGEVSLLEAQLFDSKTNLLETSSISGDKEKTYTIKKKMETVGSSEVKIFGKDKQGNGDTLILGKITVNQTTIAKETTKTNQTQQNLFAGFKDSFKNYWYLFVLGGVMLAGFGYWLVKRIKSGRAIKIATALWDL